MGLFFMCNMYRSIQFLCQNKGVTITQMSRETNIPRSVFSELKSGRTKQLSSKYLPTLSEYFGVSIDYLLGNTEQKEKASIPKDEREITLDDFTFAMQNETKDLTDMDKQILLSMARQLNDARKKKNGEPG